jgi:protocatechuate 3,4-dioxygenase beta subunit
MLYKNKKENEKMRKNYMVMLVVFIMFGMFQGSLYSYVESQIEGVIVDDETGLPLKGAYIDLIYCRHGVSTQYEPHKSLNCSNIDSEISKKDGTFKIPDVKPGNYFLQVFLDGYSAIGPLLYLEDKEALHFFWDDYEFGYMVEPLKIKTFKVKEGRIKYFKIRLKKEAKLKVNVMAKYPGIGTVQYKNGFLVELKHEKILNEKSYSDDDKTYQITTKYLKAGKAKIEIGCLNYGRQKYEVNLENGKTTEINCLLDFTKGEVVYGVIRDKTGKPIEGTDIDIYPLNDEKLPARSAKTDKYGKYWLGDLKPGVYHIDFSDFDIKFIIIQIKPDEMLEFNKEF